MPVFFISSTNIQDHQLTLDGDLYSHLAKSLRIRQGEMITVNDEHKRRYRVRVTKITKRILTGEIEKTYGRPQEEKPAVTLVQSILRGPNMAWVIQKATELGVSRVFPVSTERVKSRSGIGSSHHNWERWKKIALEAAQQSERWDLPEISTPQPLEEIFQQQSSDSHKYILTERQGDYASTPSRTLLEQEIGNSSHVVLAVGPEGGWTQEEIHLAHANGFRRVTLGEKVLRSETATLTALIILKSKFKHIRFSLLMDSPPIQLE